MSNLFAFLAEQALQVLRVTDWPALRAALEWAAKRVFAVDTTLLPVEGFETVVIGLSGEALILLDGKGVET
jgi:hypothetical protein